MWQSIANVASKNTHNINKLLENNISDARNCAIVNSGTTGSFLYFRSPFSNCIYNEGICVAMRDSNKTTATNTVIFYIQYILMEVRKAHIFEQLENALISISSFCNHGYIAVFYRDNVTIIKYYDIIMQKTRHQKSGLWMIDLIQNGPMKR